MPVEAQVTCVDASRQETLEIADTFARAGVQDIVALRGDPPKGQDRFVPHPEGFTSSVELIEALAETEMFSTIPGLPGTASGGSRGARETAIRHSAPAVVPSPRRWKTFPSRGSLSTRSPRVDPVEPVPYTLPVAPLLTKASALDTPAFP